MRCSWARPRSRGRSHARADDPIGTDGSLAPGRTISPGRTSLAMRTGLLVLARLWALVAVLAPGQTISPPVNLRLSRVGKAANANLMNPRCLIPPSARSRGTRQRSPVPLSLKSEPTQRSAEFAGMTVAAPRDVCNAASDSPSRCTDPRKRFHCRSSARVGCFRKARFRGRAVALSQARDHPRRERRSDSAPARCALTRARS